MLTNPSVNPKCISDTRIQTLPKRKRTPSPITVSKRAHHLRDSSSTSNQTEKVSSVRDLAKSQGFNPRYIDGNSAHEWREFMVHTVFSQRRPTVNQHVERPMDKEQGQKGKHGNSGKGTPKSSGGNVPAIMHGSDPEQEIGTSLYTYRIQLPHGFNHQLPAFSLPHRLVTNTPETKATLAYVVVGPRARGKFDSAKAKALGVPNGPQRRDLTQGKTIRFLVPDDTGRGGMVERIVRPSDIIGESENPSVSVARPS